VTHGILYNVPAAEYYTRELGVASKSALDRVHVSGAHYRAWLDGKGDDSTAALDFGGALHCALLEPERFATSYTVEPSFGDCRKTDNKARRDAWRLANTGKTCIGEDDHTMIVDMVTAVNAHPLAGRLVAEGEPEVTLRWRDQATGLECKSRADLYVPRLRICADIKTTIDARSAAFARSVANYRYHVQHAFYEEGFRALGAPLRAFLFICIEKAPPYAVAVFQLDPEAVERGRDHARDDLKALARFLETDQWPGFAAGIQSLSLPPWA
jgi:hypothetical protein